MALDQMSDVLHRLQSAVDRPPEPAFPERLGLFPGGVLPESPKFLLHGPSPAHFRFRARRASKRPLWDSEGFPSSTARGTWSLSVPAPVPPGIPSSERCRPPCRHGP